MSTSQSRGSGDESSGKPSSSLFPSNMRDKLQSSARDLMKSMEQVVAAGRNSKPENGNRSLESTLRAVFSSCTSGAEANVTTNKEEEYEDEQYQQEHEKTSSTHIKQASKSFHQKEMGEHIYAQLFFDDQARAAKAVSALHEINTTKKHPKPTHTPQTSYYPSQQQLHKPFPASSPSRPVHASDFDIQPTTTFDDSISAISAHTLEAMARAAAPSHHLSYPRQVPTKYEGVDPSPVFVPKEHVLAKPYVVSDFRVRSAGEQSTPSKNSQSTRTTESSSASFDHWQREENKYWVDQAKKQQQHGAGGGASNQQQRIRPSVKDLSRRTQSTATASSGSYRQHQHPHDSISGDYFFDKEPVARVATGHVVSSRTSGRMHNAVCNTGEI